MVKVGLAIGNQTFLCCSARERPCLRGGFFRPVLLSIITRLSGDCNAFFPARQGAREPYAAPAPLRGQRLQSRLGRHGVGAAVKRPIDHGTAARHHGAGGPCGLQRAHGLRKRRAGGLADGLQHVGHRRGQSGQIAPEQRVLRGSVVRVAQPGGVQPVKGRKHLTGAQAFAGLHKHQPHLRRGREGLDALADAAHARQPAGEEEGNIRTQFQAQRQQLRTRKAQPPQGVEPLERRGAVGAAAAHARARGNAFLQQNTGAPAHAAALAQKEGRPVDQVGRVVAHPGGGKAVARLGPGRALCAAGHGLQREVLRLFHPQKVAQGYGLHQHIHQVVSVRACTQNIQRPVDLGIRRQTKHCNPPFRYGIVTVYHFSRKPLRGGGIPCRRFRC